LQNDNNAEVLRYLEPLSCHGDNLELLQSLLTAYPDVYRFCPDTRNYRYILWYTGNTVFAYGAGMQYASLRIADNDAEQVAAFAQDSLRLDGSNWFSLPAYCEQLENLARLAYQHARVLDRTG
jgi:hypothetical protein